MRVCDTRWVCRFKNCKAIIDNYVAIVDTLKIEIEDQADKNVPQALGNYYFQLYHKKFIYFFNFYSLLIINFFK